MNLLEEAKKFKEKYGLSDDEYIEFTTYILTGYETDYIKKIKKDFDSGGLTLC